MKNTFLVNFRRFDDTANITVSCRSAKCFSRQRLRCGFSSIGLVSGRDHVNVSCFSIKVEARSGISSYSSTSSYARPVPGCDDASHLIDRSKDADKSGIVSIRCPMHGNLWRYPSLGFTLHKLCCAAPFFRACHLWHAMQPVCEGLFTPVDQRILPYSVKVH